MENIIGTSAFIKLQRFSNLANRDNGISDPNDKERWCEFVIEVYKTSPNRLYEEDLSNWLIDNDWNTDLAEYLAREFTNQCILLSVYDRIER